ncbi:MAG: dihydrofolate reductase family protein [bacterium]
MAKIDINNNDQLFKGLSMVNFIILDNNHLELSGVKTLTSNLKSLYLVTSNNNHPAFQIQGRDNLKIIFYENKVDFVDLFSKLKNDYNVDKLTIQSGGELNSIFLRSKLIDKISIVVAPALIGGRNTSTLIDGESLHTFEDLKNIKALKLDKVDVLKNSYIHLKYDVINETEIKK